MASRIKDIAIQDMIASKIDVRYLRNEKAICYFLKEIHKNKYEHSFIPLPMSALGC
jgi:hypothetical protein